MAGIVIAGNPANVTTPLAATVTALSSGTAGVVRVQTSAPHLYGLNDYVGVNAGPVNGWFTISAIIDSTHFELAGTTFSSTGTGTALDFSFTPNGQAPVDGQALTLNLSGLLSYLQMLSDRTQFLIQRAIAGGSHLIDQGQFVAVPGAGWGNNAGYVTTIGSSPGTVFQGQAIPVFAGDVVEMIGSYSIAFVTGVSNAQLRLEVQENYNTASPSGSTSAVTNGEQTFQSTTAAGTSLNPTANITLSAMYTVTTPGNSNLGVFLNGKVGTPTANADWQITEGNMIVRVWRAN